MVLGSFYGTAGFIQELHKPGEYMIGLNIPFSVLVNGGL